MEGRRIIIIHLNFKTGGIESQLLNLLENYRSINDILLIVCSTEGELKERFENIKGLKIIELGKYPKFLFDTLWYLKFRTVIQRLNPEIIYSAHDVFHWYVSLLTNKNRKTYLSISGFPHKGKLFILRRFVYSLSTSLVSVSRSITAYLNQHWALENVRTIQNCIVPAKCIKSKRNKDIKKIIVVCRIDANKRVLHILKSFECCLNTRRNLELHIYGDGPYLGQCKQYVSDKNLQQKVFFYGAQTKVIVHEAICEADLLVLNSLSEGLPTVVLEAWAYNTTVLVNNYKGLTDDFIKDEITGFINYDDSVEGLAKKMKSILDQDEETLLDIQNKGFKEYKKNYSLATFLSGYSEIFNE